MKKGILMMCVMLGSFASFAQDEVTFTDEDLTSYATVMAWAEAEKGRMTDVYNGWIQDNPNLEPARFVKIKDAGEDSLKLQEIEVTDVELASFQQVMSNYDSMLSSFKEVYVGKIKDDIGAGLYNSLRSELKSNAEVKSRYEAILTSLTEEKEEEDESEE